MKTKKNQDMSPFSCVITSVCVLLLLPNETFGNNWYIPENITLLDSIYFANFAFFISNSITIIFIGVFLSLLVLGYIGYHFLINNSMKQNVGIISDHSAGGVYKEVVGLLKNDIQKSFYEIMKPLSKLSFSNELSKEDQDCVNEIVDSASTLLKSMNSLSILNNYNSDNLTKQKIDLYNFSRETISLFTCFAKQRKVNLRFEYNHDQNISIEIYADRLKIVLYNLIFNSIKYSEEKTNISFIVENVGRSIRFVIRDQRKDSFGSEFDFNLLDDALGNVENNNSDLFTGWSFIQREVEELMNGTLTLNAFDGNSCVIEVPFVELLTSVADKEPSTESLDKRSVNDITTAIHEDSSLKKVDGHDHNSQGDVLKKEEVETISLDKEVLSLKDQEWLSKMDEDIASNISNIQYGVEALAENMDVSRTHLFRKVKKITGQSPNGYIREKKLLQAKQLLESGACKSVKELAYKVGILKPSYFTKLYFNRFGLKPSSYLN